MHYCLIQNTLLTKGVEEYIFDEDLDPLELESFQNIPSQGLSAMYDGKMLAGGNARLMKTIGVDVSSLSENSEFYFAYGGELLAKYELFDMPREDAKEAIGKIKKMGIKIIMLTGDHEESAKKWHRLWE